jgi:hypothetical protein
LASKAQSFDNLQWGTPVDGLQMSISAINDTDPKVPAFQVALRNVGDKDTTLNLGFMLGNGKVQDPNSISFRITDAHGTDRMVEFASVFTVEGRVDDYVVSLRAGSMYTLDMSSKYFILGMGNMAVGPKLVTRAPYTITAMFAGFGAKHTNLDTPGMKLMNYWTGVVQSNALKVP